MQKNYTVWMSVTETWKAWFEANSREEAEEIVRKLNEGDSTFEMKSVKKKGVESEYALETLEEWETT